MENLLQNVLSVQSTSGDTSRMNEFIINYLKKLKIEYYEDNGNIYATKGKLNKDEYFPCIVSHTDTVHDIIDNYKVFYEDTMYFAMDMDTLKQTGVGGDDKVGIYICLSLLKKVSNIKVAFFRDEEIGCVGSRLVDKKFFNDVGYVFQCDRKGNSDFVTSIYGQLSSKEFQNTILNIVNKYGYKYSKGGLTDVAQLKDYDINICMANMSCGYYNPHTDYECVSETDVINVENMLLDIIDLLGYTRWEHKEHYYNSYYYDYSFSSIKNEEKINYTQYKCPICNTNLCEDNFYVYCNNRYCPDYIHQGYNANDSYITDDKCKCGSVLHQDFYHLYDPYCINCNNKILSKYESNMYNKWNNI